MRLALLLTITLLLPAIGFSATIHVPGDYKTIQDAINASVDGDMILVAPGLYPENLDFDVKAITVKSSGGPQATVIDGGQVDTVVKIDGGQGPDTVLEGFTITNGVGKFGGGLMLYQSSPTVRGNIVRNNTATPYYGGGAYLRVSNAILDGNHFVENSADEQGGGVMAYASSPTMVNNVFAFNKCFSGGGVCLRYQSAVIMTNNTFYANKATSDGGGMFCTWSSSAIITNTIFWKDEALVGPEISVGDSTNPSSISIGYSDVYDYKNTVYADTGCTVTWLAGIMFQDPLFVNSFAGDYHLPFISPCVDAGDAAAPALPKTDFEGDPRVANKTCDIGADEFHRHLYYTGSATPGGKVEVKIADMGGIGPVILWVGKGVIHPPMKTPYGPWFLQPPLVITLMLGTIPKPGILIIPADIPANYPMWDVPIQALSGKMLTNLCLMSIR